MTSGLSEPAFNNIWDALLEANADQLQKYAELIVEQQRTLSLARGDLPAILDAAFENGFTSHGVPVDPWLDTSGVLIIPGYKLEKSSNNHVCSFVQIGGVWSWDSEERVHDELRSSTVKGKNLLRTITLCTSWDGLEVDRIESTTSMGVHHLKRTTSWIVKAGTLIPTGTRTRSTSHTTR
jgi:hypothetical protein